MPTLTPCLELLLLDDADEGLLPELLLRLELLADAVLRLELLADAVLRLGC